jgi:hypothetical protein
MSAAQDAAGHDQAFDLTATMATLIRHQLICDVTIGEHNHEAQH